MAESKVYVDATRKAEDQDPQGATPPVVSNNCKTKADRGVFWLDDLWRAVRYGVSVMQVKQDAVTTLRIKEVILSIGLEFAFCKTVMLREKEFLYWSKLRPAIILFIEDTYTSC